uniref:E3 ubiquitin-protein ligase TRIM22-like n=1 Tax=Scatophagus argus TaxID=75038 RepID=UPI001ED7E4DB|nr:E3 ubiquitin-protein ligase TRIM22-like [Scatophagus argus]
MATASPFISEDQFLCSICLEVFTEPVSTPCGHNFCKACISRYWEGKEQSQCPLCNNKFSKGLKLRVNTAYREVVENFRKHQRIAGNNSLVKPGQVPCDCCLGDRFKASKTCLVCLASYCEIHLEPHQRVAALKRHKLTNPVHNLEDKICKKHNRILELFCRNDCTRVCVLCTEHSAHNTVPLDEAYVDKKAQMAKKKTEVQEIKSKRGKKAKKTKAAVQIKRKCEQEAIAKEAVASSVEPDYIQVPYIWFPNEGPHQLNQYFYLPANIGISEGKYYYEIETKGTIDCYLGVVRESILRRRSFTLNTRNGNWIIRLENNTKCTALHNVPLQFFLTRKPGKVTVFVDYDNGFVSFYDADTAVPIYTFTGCKFKERVFLFYCPIKNVRQLQKLQKKIPDILLGFILMAVFLISIWHN